MTCDLKIAALWFNMPLTFLCPIYGVLIVQNGHQINLCQLLSTF